MRFFQPSKANVIELSPFLTDNRYPQIAEIDAYWTALCDGRTMPSRSDINPRGIEGALSHSFIMERLGKGEAQLRVSGHILGDLTGPDMPPFRFSQLFSEGSVAKAKELVNQVCLSPACVEMQLSAVAGKGLPALEARIKLWPLADSNGFATRVLGGIALRGHIGRNPRHFHIVSCRVSPIRSETQTAPQAPKEPLDETQKGHLRLVSINI